MNNKEVKKEVKNITKKTCYVCGKEKAIEEFYRDRTRGDGHVGYCKGCKNGHKPGYKPRIKVN